MPTKFICICQRNRNHGREYQDFRYVKQNNYYHRNNIHLKIKISHRKNWEKVCKQIGQCEQNYFIRYPAFWGN